MNIREHAALETIIDSTACRKCGAAAGKACAGDLVKRSNGRRYRIQFDEGIHNERRMDARAAAAATVHA